MRPPCGRKLTSPIVAVSLLCWIQVSNIYSGARRCALATNTRQWEIHLKSGPGTMIHWGQKKERTFSWTPLAPSVPCKAVLAGGDAVSSRPQSLREPWATALGGISVGEMGRLALGKRSYVAVVCLPLPLHLPFRRSLRSRIPLSRESSCRWVKWGCGGHGDPRGLPKRLNFSPARCGQGLTEGRTMRSLGSELAFPFFTLMGQKNRSRRLDHHLGCKFLGRAGPLPVWIPDLPTLPQPQMFLSCPRPALGLL